MNQEMRLKSRKNSLLHENSISRDTKDYRKIDEMKKVNKENHKK
jgi:hypothetical protein